MPISIIARAIHVLALASLPIGAVAAQATSDTTDRDAFVVWAARAATPLAALDGPFDAGNAGAVSRLSTFTRGARVLALGESVHDSHEFIVLRTRLTEQLIQRGLVAAVVIESGLAEGRAIDAWIAHETDTVPDFASALSYGWAGQAETLAALHALRDHNGRVPEARRVRLYGMDLPANGGGSLLPALEPVWSYLDDADPRFATESRTQLAPLAARLASQGYGIVGKYAALGAARDSLRRAIDTIGAQMRAHERAYVARTSRSRYDWARRLAELGAQTEAAVRIGWNDASNPRDVAMAENVRWILAREGARGLIVIWSHNLHVARVPIGGPMFAGRGGAPFVESMGQRLARSLGPAYLPVGTAFRRDARDSSGVAREPTSVDAALARVGVPIYLLDLRRAPRTGGAARWLATEHLARAEDGYVVTAPGRAYDAMMFVDSIQPSRRAERP
jgi:erythromycin esterase